MAAERSAGTGKPCGFCGLPLQPGRWNKQYCDDTCRAAEGRRKHDANVAKEAVKGALQSLCLPFHQEPPAPDPQAAAAVVEEKTRTGRQCERILTLLKIAPVSNRALSQVALKYTNRVSELRKRGHIITATPKGGGLFVYTLLEPAQRELPHA